MACNHFKGSHTAERICKQFEAICDEYDIKDKLDYISDNAANMRKAFTVCFPTEDEDGKPLDDPQLWHDLTQKDQKSGCWYGKDIALVVFCAYQLVVGARLKKTKVASPSFKVFKTQLTDAHKHDIQRCVQC